MKDNGFIYHKKIIPKNFSNYHKERSRCKCLLKSDFCTQTTIKTTNSVVTTRNHKYDQNNNKLLHLVVFKRLNVDDGKKSMKERGGRSKFAPSTTRTNWFNGFCSQLLRREMATLVVVISQKETDKDHKWGSTDLWSLIRVALGHGGCTETPRNSFRQRESH